MRQSDQPPTGGITMFEEFKLHSGQDRPRFSPIIQVHQLEDRVMCSATPVAADFSSARNQHSMNRIVVDGINLLQGSGFHIIGSLGTADNTDNVASESPQNSNGIMRPYRGTVGGSVPYNFTFSRNTGDASKIGFSVSLGKSANSFQVMNIPLEANLQHFTYWRHSGSTSLQRFDQIGNGTPSYTKPDTGNYYIQGTNGSPSWGEIVGSKYTIRVTITASNSPVGLSFVNAPGLARAQGGIRDVEFGFKGGLPAQQQRTLTGFIQVFRTNTSDLPRRVYQAESSPYSQIGRPNSDGRSASASQVGYLQYGPYLRVDNIEGVRNNSGNLTAGGHSATFRLLVDNNVTNNNRLFTIDIFDASTGRQITMMDITRKMFRSASTYQDFSLDFTAISGQNIEARVYTWGGANVKLDRVTLV
jgi:hypothetical protein